MAYLTDCELCEALVEAGASPTDANSYHRGDIFIDDLPKSAQEVAWEFYHSDAEREYFEQFEE